VPNTIADDGDPCDVLVITPFPLFPGVVVRCRALGVLKMTDEAGGDSKILAVPVEKILPVYANLQKVEDVPELTLRQIQHFFEHYKDLEPGKWVKIGDWHNATVARRMIVESIERAKKGG
jgi:inorganic pyrophosphatase